jgi:hypothetical protein
MCAPSVVGAVVVTVAVPLLTPLVPTDTPSI